MRHFALYRSRVGIFSYACTSVFVCTCVGPTQRWEDEKIVLNGIILLHTVVLLPLLSVVWGKEMKEAKMR